jgi:hypothetical protein
MAKARGMFLVSVVNSDIESDRFSVPGLFRRAADVIDDLGTVEVRDLVVHDEPTVGGVVPSLQVYFSRSTTSTRDRGRRHRDGDGTDASGVEDPHLVFATPGSHSVTFTNPSNEPDVDNVAKLLRFSANRLDRIIGLSAGDTVLIVDDVVLETSENPLEPSDDSDVELEPMLTVHYRLAGRAENMIVGEKTTFIADHHEHSDQATGYLKLKDRRREPGYLSRPRLLRKTAKAIEALGEVDVHAVVLHQELTDWKWFVRYVSFTAVYYGHPRPPDAGDERQRPCTKLDGGVAAAASVDASDKYVRYCGDHIHPDMAEDLDNRSFRLHNPVDEPDCPDVPTLLRRTADSIDALPAVEIDDLVLHVKVTAAGRVPTVAVYYSRPTIDDWKSRAEWAHVLDEYRTLYFARKKRARNKSKKTERTREYGK